MLSLRPPHETDAGALAHGEERKAPHGFCVSRLLTTASSKINISILALTIAQKMCVTLPSFNIRLPSDSQSVSVRYSSGSVVLAERKHKKKVFSVE